MTVKSTLTKLKKLGDDAVRKRNERNGAGDQFGVPLGEIRKVAKEIKKDHDLAMKLWGIGDFYPRMLAVLIMDKKRDRKELIVISSRPTGKSASLPLNQIHLSLPSAFAPSGIPLSSTPSLSKMVV